MNITSAEFIKSSNSYRDCPKDPLPEYAFIGRSNVGKSSLINMLTGRKGLAKISGTPGKTRQINHFLINASWYLCDLPGYGFAKVAKTTKEKWEQTIKEFLATRPNLLCSFVLIDIRHEPLKNDMEFLYWLGGKALPIVLLFTKADKLSKAKLHYHLANYEKSLSEYWEPIPQYIVTSSKTGQGKEDVLQVIAGCNSGFSPVSF